MAEPRTRIVNTNIAALYILLMEAGESPCLVTADQVRRASTRIYNAARDGKLTRHGDESWGGARWDLAEVHSLVRVPPSVG
jgi:hypothetical protein